MVNRHVRHSSWDENERLRPTQGHGERVCLQNVFILFTFRCRRIMQLSWQTRQNRIGFFFHLPPPLLASDGREEKADSQKREAVHDQIYAGEQP